MKKGANARLVLALVVSLDDEEGNPVNESRVKIRIPQIHGPEDESQLPPGVPPDSITPDEFLPWAQVCYPLGEKDPDKHSFFEEGEIVYVMFPKEDSKTPVIIGTSGSILEE